MIILSIDPGPVNSAYVIFQWPFFLVIDFNHIENSAILEQICLGMGLDQNKTRPEILVIEKPEARSQPLGKDTLETIYWTGRFVERWQDYGPTYEYNPRNIRAILTGDTKSSEKHIKSAVVDRVDPMREYGQFGKGVKKNPGPLFGFSNHFYSALAVGLAYVEENATSSWVANLRKFK